MTDTPTEREEAAVRWARRFRHARVHPTVKLVGLVVGMVRSSDERTHVADLCTVADQCALPLATVRAAIDQLTAEGWLELDGSAGLLWPSMPDSRRGGSNAA